MPMPVWVRATSLSVALVFGVGCSTGPSTSCELTTTGPLVLSAPCTGVTFISVNDTATFADTAHYGPVRVAFDVTTAFAPVPGHGYGSDNGDAWVVTVDDSTAQWINSTHYPVVGAHFDLKISSVQRTYTSGDTSAFVTHGTLDAKLAPDSSTATTDTLTLHLTF